MVRWVLVRTCGLVPGERSLVANSRAGDGGLAPGLDLGENGIVNVAIKDGTKGRYHQLTLAGSIDHGLQLPGSVMGL